MPDPKCTHLIGILQVHTKIIMLYPEDADLLDEPGGVPFNYCPWCGECLKEGEEPPEGDEDCIKGGCAD